MNEWLEAWWSFLMIPIVWAIYWWLITLRNRQIQATTRECPTCHGLGRINRAEVAP